MHESKTSAAGLHDFLRAAKSRDRNQPVHKTLRDVLGIPNSKNAELFRCLALVLQLPARVENDVRRQPGIDHPRFLKWIPKVDKVLGDLNLNAPTHQFTDPIDDAVFDVLHICDNLLSIRSPQAPIPEKELQILATDVKSLIDDILNANMDDYLKTYILDKLDAIAIAIQMYNFCGAAPLRQAAEIAIGSIAVETKDSVEFSETPLGQRTWLTIQKVATLVGGTAHLLAIIDNVRKALGK